MKRTSRWGPIAGLGLLTIAVALGCAAHGTGSERLELRGPAWSISGRAVGIDVFTAGALAENEVSLVLEIGGRSLSRVATTGGRARIVVPSEHLAPGSQSIVIKSGTERSVIEIQIVPVGYVVVGALAIAAVTAALVVRRRSALSR